MSSPRAVRHRGIICGSSSWSNLSSATGSFATCQSLARLTMTESNCAYTYACLYKWEPSAAICSDIFRAFGSHLGIFKLTYFALQFEFESACPSMRCSFLIATCQGCWLRCEGISKTQVRVRGDHNKAKGNFLRWELPAITWYIAGQEWSGLFILHLECLITKHNKQVGHRSKRSPAANLLLDHSEQDGSTCEEILIHYHVDNSV